MSNHRYVLGKTDYYNSGKRNCECAITWRLEEKDGFLVFAMQAEVWQSNKRDILMGGQCVDKVAELFPDDAKAQRMRAIWDRWHLNDMNAGSPAQMEWLRNNEIVAPYPKSHYEEASKALALVGLNPDPDYLHNGKPYLYGHAWIKEELPADVVNEIRSWG